MWCCCCWWWWWQIGWLSSIVSHQCVCFSTHSIFFTTDFSCPSNPHFSPIFGGAHNSDYVLWRNNSLPSLGVKNVAEVSDQLFLICFKSIAYTFSYRLDQPLPLKMNGLQVAPMFVQIICWEVPSLEFNWKNTPLWWINSILSSHSSQC